MSIFQHIDKKLSNFALILNALLTKDRPEYPKELRTFEERRIDWIENGINRAIIIQPTFEDGGVNNKKWNFINIAWCDDPNSINQLKWIKYIIEEKEFKNIETRIDDLLEKSKNNLLNIKINELQ